MIFRSYLLPSAVDCQVLFTLYKCCHAKESCLFTLIDDRAYMAASYRIDVRDLPATCLLGSSIICHHDACTFCVNCQSSLLWRPELWGHEHHSHQNLEPAAPPSLVTWNKQQAETTRTGEWTARSVLIIYHWTNWTWSIIEAAAARLGLCMQVNELRLYLTSSFLCLQGLHLMLPQSNCMPTCLVRIFQPCLYLV